MGLFTKDIKSMEDLFVHYLQDIYYAEKQITKALPKMIDSASEAKLERGLQAHLRETQGQIKRLERIFEMLGQEAKGTRCPAIDGILKEGDDVVGEVDQEDGRVMDAAVVGACQAVEHYEIARYNALIHWAIELGRSDCAGVLHENLAEEEAANDKLTAVADERIGLSAPRRAAARGRRSAAPRQSARRTAAKRGRAAAKKKTQGKKTRSHRRA
jgi:ferritin-like metal-binding protein YciE